MFQGVALRSRMMGNRFLGSIDHGAKKASPTTRQKGKKDHEGNNDSELRGNGHRQKSLCVILVNVQSFVDHSRPVFPLLCLSCLLSEAEGSVAEGSGGVGALGMPLALTRGRGYDHDGEPPCFMDGWLYPTPAFAGACLAQPPLTKGRKTTALLSWFPSCGQPLILSTPVLSLSKGMTEPLQSWPTVFKK